MRALVVFPLLVLLPVCFARQAYNQGRSYKTTKCYQCAYSPGKTTYKEEQYKDYETDHYGKKKAVYKTRKVPVNKPGGWEPCKGPFTEEEASNYGIDVWDCHDNCFTREDDNGNVFRGCYKGEFGVDPSLIGCNEQAGSTYCFCKGDKCNNEIAPYDKPGK